MDWIPERSTDLLSNAMEDGTVIVSPSDGSLSVVNEVGAFVWALIDGYNSVDDIVQQVVNNFNVSPETAQTDILEFMHVLEERELVTRKVMTKQAD